MSNIKQDNMCIISDCFQEITGNKSFKTCDEHAGLHLCDDKKCATVIDKLYYFCSVHLISDKFNRCKFCNTKQYTDTNVCDPCKNRCQKCYKRRFDYYVAYKLCDDCIETKCARSKCKTMKPKSQLLCPDCTSIRDLVSSGYDSDTNTTVYSKFNLKLTIKKTDFTKNLMNFIC